MRLHLTRPIDLAYCTNVHPGESWSETFENLRRYTLAVRDRVAPGRPFGVGLRLSNLASVELSDPDSLAAFKSFLERENLYVFTINAFPYGRFHGTRIKEKVFAPDWTQAQRLEYTKRVADLLAELLPEGEQGSISTAPCSFGDWVRKREQAEAIVLNLAECAHYLEQLSRRTGKSIHLGLEPEPLGYLENAEELIAFLREKVARWGAKQLAGRVGISEGDAVSLILRRLGICYDTCHMALEYEGAAEVLEKITSAGILISKFQISSAIRCRPSPEALESLRRFADDVYLHQVIARGADGALTRWPDLGPALAEPQKLAEAEELRVHYHVPLNWTGGGGLASTSDHVTELLTTLHGRNGVAHFELETYTWGVLPEDLRRRELDEAIAGEYQWFQDRLADVEDRVPTGTG